jgi:Fic family protein
MKVEFHYTPKLVNLVANAEGLYRQLESEAEIPSLSLRLIKENQALASHYSTSIEGNPLSQLEVTNIVLGDKVPTTKSEKEVKNYFDVLNKISLLAREKKSLNVDLTLSLHILLMKDLQARNVGKFRNARYVVGHKTATGDLVTKHNPPAHSAKEIEDLLARLYSEIEGDKETHPLVKAGLLHHQFVFIHPFTDGNGRMTRTLTSYELLLSGYEVTKFFVLDDYYDIDRLQYSDMLHLADSGDRTAWLEYFLEGITYSLQAAIKRVEQMKGQRIDAITGDKRVLVSRREEEVLQLLIDKKVLKTQDVVEAFGVTRQQSQSLLNSLVKKRVVVKLGKTKSSYYKLLGS